MAPVTKVLLTLAASVSASTVTAYAPISPSSETFGLSRTNRGISSSTALSESFGFDFAEDQTENTPDIILGEARYKQWVGTVTEKSFLNRQYDVVRRIREKDLLRLTAELGILSKLEKNGVTLKKIESTLPTVEGLGLISFVANNQQNLLNGIAPLLIEPAPLLLPVVAGALDLGPIAFFGAAGALLASDAYLVTNNVEIPFLGLSAGLFFGLLAVPGAALLGTAGVLLSGGEE